MRVGLGGRTDVNVTAGLQVHVWSAAMAEPVTVRSLPALTLTLLPLSRLPFSRVAASLAILWLLLFQEALFLRPLFTEG